MKIVIVIPTYNEAKNIGRLIEALSSEFISDPNNEYQVLIVEGNSPDGTALVVKELTKKYPFVNLLMEEKKAGLGAAYTFGFNYALKNLNPDVLMEMDADFQHDPKMVTKMVDQIEAGYDYVIGSRFIKGGSIPSEWAWSRKMMSIGGNIFSKLVLGIFEVNDFTSGFKASRVKGFVEKLDLTKILSEGFAYKIDLLFKMQRLGAKIKEIPLVFGLRDEGVSKMEKNNLADSLSVVFKLRYNENKSFFKFCIVGSVGLLVDTGLFNLFRITIFASNLAAIISGFIAMLTTFSLNNIWSFNERKIVERKKQIISFVVYAVSSMIPIVLRSKLVYWASVSLGDTFLVTNVAFFVGIVFGLIWNYLVYSKIIWKGRK